MAKKMNPEAIKGLKAALDKKIASGKAGDSAKGLRKALHTKAPGVRKPGTPPFKEK